MNQRENLTVFPATPPPADKLTVIEGFLPPPPVGSISVIVDCDSWPVIRDVALGYTAGFVTFNGAREEQMRKGSCLKLKACTNSQGRVDGPDDDRKSRTLGLEVI